MQRVSLNSNTNNNLVVNNVFISNSIEVSDLNITNDVYINNSLFTPVGSILTYAGASAPAGWLLCDGSEVSQEAYPRLYAVLGSTYGSPANPSNFVLPNLADRVPVGKSGGNSLGNAGGNSSITLSVSQLPSHNHTGTTDSNGSHNHTVNDSGHLHSVEDAYYSENRGLGQNMFGTHASSDNDNDLYTRNISSGISTTGISLNSNGNHTHTFTTGYSGSGRSIDIRNKFVVLNYIIRC